MTNIRQTEYVVEIHDFKLTASIPPYSWGMPKIDVDVSEWQARGRAIVSERLSLGIETDSLKTTDDVLAALELAVDHFTKGGTVVPFVRCVRCATRRLDVSGTNRYEEDLESDEPIWNVDRTNHRPLCDGCFCAGLQAKMDAHTAEQAAQDVIEDAAQKAKGCTHKIEYWIHPKAGGDDYQCVAYWNPLDSGETEPSKRTIGGLLRKSSVKNDFRVVAL